MIHLHKILGKAFKDRLEWFYLKKPKGEYEIVGYITGAGGIKKPGEKGKISVKIEAPDMETLRKMVSELYRVATDTSPVEMENGNLELRAGNGYGLPFKVGEKFTTVVVMEYIWR